MAAPVVYIEQQFSQLKSFMARQPKSWAPTDNPVVDAANKVRYQLRDTADKYIDKNFRTCMNNHPNIIGSACRIAAFRQPDSGCQPKARYDGVSR